MPRIAAPLVGRSAELDVLTAAVRDAADGHAGAVIVGGDAGVGKTRLLTELAASLTSIPSEGRVRSLAGHCVDLGDTPPPYLPFTEAFTRLADEQPDVADELVERFPAITRLLHNHSRTQSRPRNDTVDTVDRVERGELFDAVRGALAHLADRAPVVLFVEDVHWADQATRDLLGFLFTRLDGERLAIIASYRSDDLHRRHPLRRTLAEWARLPAVTRINVEPLEADDVRTLIRSMHGGGGMDGGVSEDDVDGIVRRAEGNAFFAEELHDAAVQCAGAQQLPWQLADLLLVRLDRLSDDSRQVVRVAAVAGRRVSHTVLEEVAGLPDRQLDDALREAIDAHVLQLTSGGRGYTFRHALLAEAVYDDLLPGERVRLHAAYAEYLAADPDHRAAELARHAHASHDLDTAFEASIAAGDEAMALAAPQEALQHYEAALELAPRIAEVIDRPQLILAAVEAADAAGFTQRGVRMADRALRALPADAAPLDRAVLLFAAVKAAMGNEIGEDVLGRAVEALRLTPGEPSEFRARLLGLHGRVALGLGRETEAEKSLQEAATMGESVGSRIAVVEAQATLAVLERRKGDPIEAARLLETAAAEAQTAGDYGSEVRSRFSLASMWHEQSELERAELAFQHTHERAVATGRQWEIFGVHSRAMTATVQYIRGEWDAALRTVDTSGERPTAVADAILRSTGMTIRGAQGDETLLDELDLVRPYWSREGRIGLYAAQGALEIYEQRGDVDSALRLIDEVVEILGEVWLNPWFLARIQLSALGLATIATAAGSASKTQHADLAAEAAQLLEDGRTSGAKGLPSTREMGREGRAWLARIEAEAARVRWLTGVDPPSPDDLVAAWQLTVDEFGFGHQLQLARSRARLAAALRATGHSADAAEAAETARAAAQRLGAAPLLAEIRALGAGVARRAAGESSGLTALTDRENGVLAELVEGRTNRQIAALLYISEKTVSVHVSNILAKLGVRSRAEAAALARRHTVT